MARSKAAFLAVLMMLCAVWSCDSRRAIIDSYVSLPSTGWDTYDTLSYPIDSIESSGDYTLAVHVRTTRNIPFQSIKVVVEQNYDKPQLQLRDTMEVELADDQGNLEGQGLYLYTTGTDSPHSLHLSRGQRGEVRLTHIMRCDPLPSIRDVGISISSH